MLPLPPTSTLFPYTTLFRSSRQKSQVLAQCLFNTSRRVTSRPAAAMKSRAEKRSEEHTSELQSQSNLVCRLQLEKKNTLLARIHHVHHRILYTSYMH